MLALARGLHPLRTREDVAFTAWFGPIGVAAVFYATLVVLDHRLRRYGNAVHDALRDGSGTAERYRLIADTGNGACGHRVRKCP